MLVFALMSQHIHTKICKKKAQVMDKGNIESLYFDNIYYYADVV